LPQPDRAIGHGHGFVGGGWRRPDERPSGTLREALREALGNLREMSRSGRGLRLVTEPARHPSAGGQRVLVVDHPIVAHRLSVLRAVETDNATFGR